MRYLLTAEEFGAQQAYRIGLVQEVVPVGEQLERAVQIAELIAAQAPLGVQATLASARVARDDGEEAARAHLKEVLAQIMTSEDAAEGVRSFLERRQARFMGR
jgi:enoyl-CoA hydratase/carnithine racemase